LSGQQANQVEFVVEYEDGRTASIFINRRNLVEGDRVVRSIVLERQDRALLPRGRIVSVKRVPLSWD
jgi:hypothetical protein